MFLRICLILFVVLLSASSESLSQTRGDLLKEAFITGGDSVVVLRTGWPKSEPSIRSHYLNKRIPPGTHLKVDSVQQSSGLTSRTNRWIRARFDGQDGWVNAENADIMRVDAWEELVRWNSNLDSTPGDFSKNPGIVLGEPNITDARDSLVIPVQTILYDPGRSRYAFRGTASGLSESFTVDTAWTLVWEFDGLKLEIVLKEESGKEEPGIVASQYYSGTGRVQIENAGTYRIHMHTTGDWVVAIYGRSGSDQRHP